MAMEFSIRNFVSIDQESSDVDWEMIPVCCSDPVNLHHLTMASLILLDGSTRPIVLKKFRELSLKLAGDVPFLAVSEPQIAFG